MNASTIKINPRLDLVLERVVDVPPNLVWAAWTQPEIVKKWFCPRPWQTVECEMDLRPGGIFRSVMRGPNGEQFDNSGCFLEIVENQRLVFTEALGPGFRPKDADPHVPAFTGVILLEPHGKGTKYTAIAIHKDEAGAQAHEKMGFSVGWGIALDQLVEVARAM